MLPEQDIARQLTDIQKRLAALERQRSGANRLIDSVVLTAPSASVTFASIPNIYDHLLILTYARGTRVGSNTSLQLRLNGDAGANYDWFRGQMNTGGFAGASLIAATSIESGFFAASTAPANTFDMGYIRINNYTNTINHKSILGMSGLKAANVAASVFVFLNSGWWRDTSAINTILLFPLANNFDAGSRFDLYGIQGGQ